MKKIVVFVYEIVKKYMLKEAEDTGNKEFVVRITAAFTLIEKVWAEINAPQPKENK